MEDETKSSQNQNEGKAESQNEGANGQKEHRQIIAKTILIIIGLAILGYLGWYLFKFMTEKDEPTLTTATPNTAEEVTPACESTLTDADKGAMVGWKTYTNGVRKYTFQYPQTWWISSGAVDHPVLRENESKIKFEFKSGADAVPETTGYTVESTDSKEIACETATIKNYEKGDYRLMVATFTKDGRNYVIQETYQYLGASVGGDIVDAWKLTLKSIEFTP